MTLSTLRWLTVVIPIAFLAAMDYVRHFVFPELLHPFWGYLSVLAIVAAAAALFSYAVFGVIDRMEARILHQNRELAAVGETVRRQVAQLHALNEAGLALASDLALEMVLQRGVDLARELAGARYGALSAFGDDDDIVYFLTSGLTVEERVRLGDLPRGHGLLGAVFAEGRPIRVDGIARDPRSVGFPAHHPPMTTFIGVPIIAKGQTLGAIYLTDKMGPEGVVHFTADDEEVLRLFAAHAAAALGNARLHSKVESLAAAAERERIARELHDSLAQALGYINVASQAAQMALNAGNTADIGQVLDRIRSAAEVAYADVREAILGLRSRVGADRDLVGSLREYIERFRLQGGVRAELEVVAPADRLRLTPAAEVQLLRIVQEALTNVRKHARAHTAKVRLEQAAIPGFGLVLMASVEDDGQGFDPIKIASPASRYGLATMRERAEGAGGRLRLETAPGSGTRVVVELPAVGFPVSPGDKSD